MSVPAAVPKFVRPCIPTTGELPKGPTWLHEPKWDGYRCQIVKAGKTVHIYSRNGIAWTQRLPSTAQSFRALSCRSVVLDGELCLSGPDGRPDFRALMLIMRSKQPDPTGLTFYAFDLLHLNGADLTGKWLIERKQRLRALADRTGMAVPSMYLVDHFDDGQALLKWCEEFGLEGVVSKRRDSHYTSGPSRHWVKVKTSGWREANRERHKLFEHR
jgi:bifunctional non-homologous end joining protein LigD